MQHLIDLIKSSQKIILSTHRQCDGDGLGAQMALAFALRKMGKSVEIINVDRTPRKYRFLEPDVHIIYFEENPKHPIQADLTLIFDTNDERLLGDLFPVLHQNSKHLAFIDHHPILKHGPHPTNASWIDMSCASTGEMVYKLISELKIELDREIARCLYTSITFDTQLYRFIRSSPVSHEIAAKLLLYNIDPEEVHRHLFGNMTAQKVAFLAHALGSLEYFANNKIAVLLVKDSDMKKFRIDFDESRDVIDMIMNIESVEAAVMFRQDADDIHKVSLRSKGKIEVVSIAEAIGGGGHKYASGAFYQGSYNILKTKIVDDLILKLSQVS
ncbi:MAG: DHH family phosphoesterase [Bdellovibrionia bacterium]